MIQYHQLLESILEKGSIKEAARANMPSTKSLFGYQMRFDLSKGFPILTTKQINFKHIVAELLWFLRGQTNVKYLIDQKCNVWNEDAYNFYKKIALKNERNPEINAIYQGVSNKLSTRYPKKEDVDAYSLFTYEEFVSILKTTENIEDLPKFGDYILGSTGKQYGWLMRSWQVGIVKEYDEGSLLNQTSYIVDQIKDLIKGINQNPFGRRHIVTSWNPGTLDDMALNACHAMTQFNCREIPHASRIQLAFNKGYYDKLKHLDGLGIEIQQDKLGQLNIPKYYLDCQMYQRSADVFLGVPYNISSYALLTHVVAKICNMEVGDFVHTFGDVHIYDNHIEQVNMILIRDPNLYALPSLSIVNSTDEAISEFKAGSFGDDIDCLFRSFNLDDFQLENYQSYPPIKAKLSTGLK